jgi:uncharacterized protein with PhoU and TrkA domain
VSNPISIEGKQLGLVRLTISPGSQFAGKTVVFVEENYYPNIVLLRHDHRSEMHPADSALLGAGDTLAVLGGPEPLNHLLHDND